MLQDELLKVQERPFVGNFLSDLDERLPGVLCSELRTVGTLAVLDEVFDLKNLFEDGVGKNLISLVSNLIWNAIGRSEVEGGRRRKCAPLFG